MPCYHPLKAYRSVHKNENGKRAVVFNQSKSGSDEAITLPCGQCVGCRLQRSREWAVRCLHEASMYRRNCFITLTYAPEHCPEDFSLHYDHFQEFMKRFRFHYKGYSPVANNSMSAAKRLEISDLSFTPIAFPIRFYMAGEYGENFGRPHYHACIFNFDFDDRVLFKKTESGSLIYTSKKLSELWPFGFVSIGNVDFQSAAYVARYIMKKMTGSVADFHYEWINKSTGEIFWRRPEFNKMSLKPGIGANWLAKFHKSVYPRDFVTLRDGRQVKAPKYYDKLLERAVLEPDKSRFMIDDRSRDEYDTMMDNRVLKAQKMLDDNTPDRLAVKEQVALARLAKLKRKLS